MMKLVHIDISIKLTLPLIKVHIYTLKITEEVEHINRPLTNNIMDNNNLH